MQELGNRIRVKEGHGALARRAAENMDDSKNYVITSIRHPMEVKELAKLKHFILINIKSPAELRYKRMVSRFREGENKKTFEEFLKSEKKEMESGEDGGQKIKDCIEMAQFEIVNDSSIEEFFKKINILLPDIINAASFKRHSWDEYFMEIMRIVGSRGTCSRGRSGCVIVRDKRILTTGYVGSPPGLAHCDEVGHWFREYVHDDGSVTKHCIRTVHAEANAIAQAAKMGISVEGATLYCKMEPCLDCTKLLISSGIKRIVCEKKYHAAKESEEMLEEAGVKLEVLNNEVEEYPNQ